jgi:hypothetical protein
MLPGKVGGLLMQPIVAPTDLAVSQRGNLVVGSALPVRDRHTGQADGTSTSGLKFQLTQPSLFSGT